jgi:glycosyltransferase involved in cell wall biosynthesis
MRYPKVLVISNNCFSETNANGRTLGNLFKGWPQKALAQFYIKDEISDFKVCSNFYRITDWEVVKSLFSPKHLGKQINSSDKKLDDINNKKLKKIKKNPLTNLIRNFFWSFKGWMDKGFLEWIDEFSPEVVLLQAGDAPFMYKIALDIAERHSIPFVIFNTEDYYFKNKYHKKSKLHQLFYPFSHSILKKQFKNAMKKAILCIYHTQMLKDEYDNEFDNNGIVLWTSSSIDLIPHKKNHDSFKISYLGNLGHGRHGGLIEIGDCLEKMGGYKLSVYGPLPSQKVEKELTSYNGIEYVGVVGYNLVREIMQNSDLLIYTECSDKKYKSDLKNAFSTKIADSLASGVCLFAYGPKNIASIDYLIEHDVACVATSKEMLEGKLKRVINDDALRKKCIENALKLARKNHDIEKNAEEFKNNIIEIYKSGML